MRPIHRTGLAGLATAAVVAALATPVGVGVASAQPGTPGAPSGGSPGSGDTREIGPDVKAGLSKAKAERQANRLNRQAGVSEGGEPAAEGDVQFFVSLDDVAGQYFVDSFELRSLGENIEVWVQEDTSFPDGDCRNDLGLTDITTAQTDAFVTEFDDNILPKESASFSVAPDRDGSDATFPGLVDGDDGPDAADDPIPSDYYEVDASQADDVVALISNVRDANYYDPGTPDGQTYIAGFFSTQINGFFDRNVMTIDAYDWKHRTGTNTPDDVDTPAYADCTQELGLNRPLGSSNDRLYEGTFAHEYQHLLESYEDPDEETWINEGLSDYAQTLVGYVDTNVSPSSDDADGHISCFQGYSDPAFGGPENSLTLWQDQGGPEILCDYGAAYTMMMYLESHYGEEFMSALHRSDTNGLPSLDEELENAGADADAMETLHNWLAMSALDKAIDKSGTVKGGKKKDLTSSQLKSKINWDNPQAFNSPGAPPNGADFVRLRVKGQKYLTAKQLRTLTFKGARTLPAEATEWTVDTTPPGTIPSGDNTCGTAIPDGSGPAALYTGCGADLDRSIAHEVSVPATGDATLSFDANYDLEANYDFAFAQVSDDGGETWTSLATEDTVGPEAAAPDVDASTVAQLPGYNGESGGFQTQTADLSDYAGEDVLIGFRYIADPAVNEAGLWVRDISVGDTAVPTDTLDGWQSYEQVNPTEVPGWTVQLVGIQARTGNTWIHQLKLSDTFKGSLSKKQLNKVLGTKAQTVAAIVTMDDPSESVSDYGTYSLTVNGKLQPGGGS